MFNFFSFVFANLSFLLPLWLQYLSVCKQICIVISVLVWYWTAEGQYHHHRNSWATIWNEQISTRCHSLTIDFNNDSRIDLRVTQTSILTAMMEYELDIMAINMLRRTIILIMEYEPNIKRPQNLVKLLIPVSSNDCKSTRPKLAQNRDCEVSNRLAHGKIKQIC